MDRLALLVAPLLVGVCIGYARGGRLRHLTTIRVPGLWLLWIAAGLQAVQFHVEPARRLVQEAAGVPLRVLIYAIPLAWFARSARDLPRGLWLPAGAALSGMVCNALPILLNGRMPYVGEAARLAGVPADLMTSANPPATRDTVLITLADVIPVPGVHAVVSVGDLLLMAGVAASIVALMPARSAATTKDPDVEADHSAARRPADQGVAGSTRVAWQGRAQRTRRTR